VQQSALATTQLGGIRNRLWVLASALIALLAISPAHAQNAGTTTATIDTTAEAGEADAVPRRRFTKFNEYDGPISTFRYGFGFIYEAMGVEQDEASKQQIDMEPDAGLRDFRLLFKGRFKTKRPISWTMGYMYDGAEDEWRFRQTGILVAVPELAGKFFIGRTKEGYSQTKVMVGYFIWGAERSQSLDAFIPILADGIKYMGYLPKQRLAFSLGWFGDVLSEKEKFSTADNQVVTHLVWQPILSEESHEVLHLGIMGRRAKPDDGFAREKSKPGAYLAPNFLDTGKFAADQSRTMGLEAVYRNGPLLFAGEYNWQQDDALTGERPVFHGGDATMTWMITGETRPYNAPAAFFNAVSPDRSVFDGGGGAVEAILNVSYNDFDDGSFQGGKFSRLTSMINWHLDDLLHVSFIYGYSKLDRFGLTGTTQFFQTRFLIYL